MDYEIIGKIIKEKRKRLKYTQLDLSKLCNVSDASIVHIEKGKASPSFYTLSKILNALDLVIYITEYNDKKKHKKIANMSLVDVGKAIRTKRKQIGISQAKVCRITGISTGTMYRIEKGESSPTIVLLNKILRTLFLDFRISDKE